MDKIAIFDKLNREARSFRQKIERIKEVKGQFLNKKGKMPDKKLRALAKGFNRKLYNSAL